MERRWAKLEGSLGGRGDHWVERRQGERSGERSLGAFLDSILGGRDPLPSCSLVSAAAIRDSRCVAGMSAGFAREMRVPGNGHSSPSQEAAGHEDGCDKLIDRKSTRLNSSHIQKSRMPSSA